MTATYAPGERELATTIRSKRDELKALWTEVEGISGDTATKSAKLASIGRLNTELNGLIDRWDAAGYGKRQIDPQDSNPEYDGTRDAPGILRAVKSADKFGDAFGGSTNVSLDEYLRAAITGRWDDIPESLWGVRGRKDMSTALGDLTLPVPLANRVIDLSRSASRVVQAGAQTVRMTTGELTFGKLSTEPTAAWKNENALITASDAEFVPVTLTARTLAARVVMSVELAEDSPQIANATEQALTAALAAELDRAALLGSGTPPEPRGLINTSGVLTIDTSAGVPANYADFSLAVQRVREANLEPNAVILGPDVIGELERLVDGNGNPLQPPESYRDLRKLSTTKLADTAVVGDWSQLVIGMRQDIRIEASRLASDENGKGFSSYSLLVRATLRADVVPLKTGGFVVLTDIDAEIGS